MVGIGREPGIMGPRRGDIHWVEFPEVAGYLIHGPHPGVIVQTDRLGRSSTVVVVPMTSAAVAAEFRPPFLVQVRARDAALPRDGWVKCDQPMTLPVMLLGPKAGRLNLETLDRVDGALRFALGL